MRYLIVLAVIGLSLAGCGKTDAEKEKEKGSKLYSFQIGNVKAEGEALSAELMPTDKVSAETAIRISKPRK